MNEYDSECVASLLLNKGWSRTEDPKKTDLFVINTCSVREKPIQKLFSQIGRYQHQRKSSSIPIFVTGCVAQQLGKELLKKNRKVDGVFSPEYENMIPDAFEKGKFPIVMTRQNKGNTANTELFPENSHSPEFNSLSSFVSVMHGCNNFCTYCIVPFLRGRENSRSYHKIEKEIKQLLSKGVREITLLGQNVNSYYDNSEKMDFTELLYKTASIPGLKRLRFVTSHPKDFTQKLAEAFAEIENLMPYLHLPAQTGSNSILKKMERGYSREEYIRKIETVKKYCPDISLSSDFITGFPGETDKDFSDTVSLLDEIGYDTIFAFAYSQRPMTKAARKFEDTLSHDIKLSRLNKLLEHQKNIMKKVRSRFLNRTETVLIEGSSKQGETMYGRTAHNIVTHVRNTDSSHVGQLIKVHIKEILKNTLRGDFLP